MICSSASSTAYVLSQVNSQPTSNKRNNIFSRRKTADTSVSSSITADTFNAYGYGQSGSIIRVPSADVVLNSSLGGLAMAYSFVATTSKASLIFGSVCGSHLIAAAFLIIKNKRKLGNLIGGRFSSTLAVTMGKVFLQSGRFMPGLIASTSVVATIYNAVGFFVSKRKERAM